MMHILEGRTILLFIGVDQENAWFKLHANLNRKILQVWIEFQYGNHITFEWLWLLSKIYDLGCLLSFAVMEWDSWDFITFSNDDTFL